MDRRLRERVWQRAQDCCEYCQFPAGFTPVPFQIDHVLAEKHGGRSELENLALACFFCNTYKGPNIAGIDPVEASLTRLFNPRTDRWEEHFRQAGAQLEGLTPVGRTTIAVLRMNHPDALAVRQSLIAEGLI
jgi:hypothetical protein